MTKTFNFQKVGELGSSRGVDGGIKFIGKEEVFAYLLQSPYVFIRMKDGNSVPFLIEDASFKGNYILHLEGIQSPEDAKVLTGCAILAEPSASLQELLDSLEASDLEYAFLKNYLLHDATSGFQSRVMEVESYPQQEMAILESQHLVPLHEDFILEIDKGKQFIKMELPEGLFEE